MEALRIITEEHQNLWRIATTLDMVADEIDGGGHVAGEHGCDPLDDLPWSGASPPVAGAQLDDGISP